MNEKTPLVMGHEAVGTVHAVGSAVSHLSVGDCVAIEPGSPCRSCARCKEGYYNLCPSMKFAACPPDTPGTLSKYFKIPADFCYKLPVGMRLEEGVLAEPLAVAVHAVRMIDVRPGQFLIVFGCGTVGILCAAVARLFGARKVIAVDILEQKLEFAKTFNKCNTFKPNMQENADRNATRLMRDNNLGLGADGVIEASGAESSINTAIHAVRPGGSIVQTGLGKPKITFPVVAFSEKEIHMHGAFRYGQGDFQIAMDILEDGSINVQDLITSIFPFEKATDAWEATKAGKGIKNMIRGVSD